MRLVDTNIFIYAVGGPHEYRASCVRLTGQFERREMDVNIDTELLQEVLYRFWRVGRHEQGINLFDTLITAFPDPLPIFAREVRLARDVLNDHRSLAPRDAIHAAVVLAHGLEGDHLD